MLFRSRRVSRYSSTPAFPGSGIAPPSWLRRVRRCSASAKRAASKRCAGHPPFAFASGATRYAVSHPRSRRRFNLDEFLDPNGPHIGESSPTRSVSNRKTTSPSTISRVLPVRCPMKNASRLRPTAASPFSRLYETERRGGSPNAVNSAKRSAGGRSWETVEDDISAA